MDINSSHIAFLDACFVSQMKRIDDTCELIEYVSEITNAESCVVDKQQYQKTRCKNYSPPCQMLGDLISDEKVIEFAHSSSKINDDLEKVYTDPVDAKIFVWACTVDKVIVWSCDKNLLSLCNSYKILHGCFKSAIKFMDSWLGGAIVRDGSYNTDLMEEGDDPFFHYNQNSRCESHCGFSSTCICYKKGLNRVRDNKDV